MSFYSKLANLIEIKKSIRYGHRLGLDMIKNLPNYLRGFDYSLQWKRAGRDSVHASPPDWEGPQPDSPNPLRAFFDSRRDGRGIWKWEHYFDIYHRHFSRFIGREVHVLEIGIYSGGSLEMWRNYFGPKSRIYGVDIQPECKCYENEFTKIFTGDQGDREFWKTFKEKVPFLDILIDDGGHQTEQQIVTLEEMLPHLRPGGIFLCEDIHGKNNGFAAYMHGIANHLNMHIYSKAGPGFAPTDFQRDIQSAHFYPYVAVLEKNRSPLEHLIAPRHGTEWQPFL